MFQLTATGPDDQQQWRRQAEVSFQTRLGRDSANGWSVPWDLRISREHADIEFHSDRLEIRCLESARNPAIVNGETARQFFIRPGQEFRIGFTVFRLDQAPEANENGGRDLVAKIKKGARGHDEKTVVRNLEAVLDFLHDDTEAEYEPEHIDDHLPLEAASSPLTSEHPPPNSPQQLAKQIERLNRELLSSSMEQKRLTLLLLQSNRESQSLRKEIQQKQSEIDDQQNSIDQSVQALADQQAAAIARIKQQHKKRLATAAKEIKEVEQQSAQLNDQLKRMCDERVSLLEELERERSQNRKTQSEVAAASEKHHLELTELDQARQQMLRERQDLDARALADGKQREAGAQTVEALRRRVEELESALQRAEETIRDASQPVDLTGDPPATELRETAALLEQERNQVAALQDQLRQFRDAQDAEAGLQKNLNTVNSQLRRESVANQDWARRCAELAEQLDSQQQEQDAALADAIQRGNDKQQLIESLQANSQAWKSRVEREIESHRQTNLELERLMNEISTNHLLAAHDRADLLETIRQKDDEISSMKTDLEAMEQRLQLNMDIVKADEMDTNESSGSLLDRLKVFASRRGRLIEWMREQLETTKGRLQREAAQRRKINAYARRLEQELEVARMETQNAKDQVQRNKQSR